MSGKTEDLIGRLRTLERVEAIRHHNAEREGRIYQPREIGIYKHALDTRYSETEIASHGGQRLKATAVHSAEMFYHASVRNQHQIVACDEVQFFMEKSGNSYTIVEVIQALLKRNIQLILSGLDKDFRGMPFGPMGDILALADERVSHTSTCARCGAPAVLPQRLINGRPAEWTDPVVFPGATESYEPRCRRCHVITYDAAWLEVAAMKEH